MFGGRWYALTARLLLAHGHFEVARLVVTEGRVNYPKSPDLFVVLGLLNEWRGGLGLDSGDLRGFIVRGELFDRGFGGAGPGAVPYRGNALREVQLATEDYRRAIELDPTHAGARLRLAWAHLLAADRRVWEDVSAGVHQADEPRGAVPGPPASRHVRRARTKRTGGARRVCKRPGWQRRILRPRAWR